MRKQNTLNRPWVALACVMAAAGAGCTSTANPMMPTSSMADASTTVPVQTTAPVQRTAGAFDTVQTLLGPDLAAVRRATAQFHDTDVATAAGYVIGEPCVSSPAGAMGSHAPNPALVANQAIDPERPEVLLYLEKPGGGMKLIGVEYLQPVLLRNTETGQVGPWFSESPWPATYQVVNPTPHLFGQTFDGPMPGHSPTMPWHWDFHVWIWAHNPSGMFAQWNPAVSCD